MKTSISTARSSIAGSSHPTVSLTQILVPVDFSPTARAAFKYALRLAAQFKSQLTLLNVTEPAFSPSFTKVRGLPAFSEKKLTHAEKELRVLMNLAHVAGVSEARSTLRSGIASHEIVEVAKDLDVDLIVIGTHGYTGWKHFCIGSTAERVVRAAHCPVLVVREKEHEFA